MDTNEIHLQFGFVWKWCVYPECMDGFMGETTVIMKRCSMGYRMLQLEKRDTAVRSHGLMVSWEFKHHKYRGFDHQNTWKPRYLSISSYTPLSSYMMINIYLDIILVIEVSWDIIGFLWP